MKVPTTSRGKIFLVRDQVSLKKALFSSEEKYLVRT